MQKLLKDNLPGANILPFVGIVTTDMKWVAGCAGYKSADELEAVLATAEKSPLLEAKPDVAKKLEALAGQAGKAAEKASWKDVLAASKAAGDLKGRSPARDKIAEAVAKARAWAAEELTKAVESVRTGGDRGAVRASLAKIAAAFAGEPEGKDADAGAKAISKLTTIDTLPAEQQTAAKEKAAKDFADGRWAALFSGDAK